MSKDFQDALANFTIFSNIYSVLNPCTGIWPVSMNLPSPTASPMQLGEKLPNIFPDEPRKKCKTVTACPHSARKHYAKNMCNNCYHRLGRDKTAWACEHHDRKHYAKGKCQFCYLKNYNKSRQEIQSSIDNI
jgi:hypothetical protein